MHEVRVHFRTRHLVFNTHEEAATYFRQTDLPFASYHLDRAASSNDHLRKSNLAQRTGYTKPFHWSRSAESAATPMPRMGIGLAKAGSLTKSLGTNAKAPSSSIAGSVPKLGSSGSSFAERLISQVADGRIPRDVVHDAFESQERDVERQDSIVSPKGSRVTSNVVRPGMHIGIRGPVHNGFHTIDTVENGLVTMKCQDGHNVTIPLSDLQDHEVIHARENL